MSKQSHTPGPWTNTLGLIQGHVSTTDTVIRPTIALVAQTTTSAKANAQLIAAAPEMLEALVSIYNMANLQLALETRYSKKTCDMIMRQMQEAIAKARGGES